jgi:hypothetical protein
VSEIHANEGRNANQVVLEVTCNKGHNANWTGVNGKPDFVTCEKNSLKKTGGKRKRQEDGLRD